MIRVLCNVNGGCYEKNIKFYFYLNCCLFFGFAQNDQTSIGTADLSNGGKISIMSVSEVSGRYTQPSEGYRFIAFDIFIDNSSGNSDISFGAYI
jgi:hypothetical protein